MFALRLLVLMMFMALLPCGVHAGVIEQVAPGLQDLINAVEKPFTPDSRTGAAPLQDVTADFFQHSTLADKNKEAHGDGQMYLRTGTNTDPVMFRFDYFRPMSQEVVCDGQTMWVYMPENRKVIQSDVGEFLNPNISSNKSRPTNFLSGLHRISKDFLVTIPPQSQDQTGNYILELTPRRASASILKLFITVRRDTVMRNVLLKKGPTEYAAGRQELRFPIMSTTVVDHQGNQTTMEFSNIKTNSNLPNSFFTFRPPPNVQVVRPQAESN